MPVSRSLPPPLHHDCYPIIFFSFGVYALGKIIFIKTVNVFQGAFSTYRLNQLDGNPLSRKRKREKERQTEAMQSQDIHVTSENKGDDQKRQHFADSAFGCNPQPVLERVEFKMQTRLRSRQHFPRLNRPISCNVTFEGPSVIEGIKNLGSQSFVDVPLPSYLANLHSLSKNSFFLTEKKTSGEN